MHKTRATLSLLHNAPCLFGIAKSDIGQRVSMTDLDDNYSLAAGCVALAAAGVANHLFCFIHGDHNPYAHRWITRSLTAIALLGCAVFCLTRFRAIPTAVITSLFPVSFFTALFTSISLYRLFFHSFGRFPGPFWARLSNLYHAYVIQTFPCTTQKAKSCPAKSLWYPAASPPTRCL